MQLPWLLQFSDLALLFMRVLVGLVFISSGSSHFKDPVTRGKSIGMSPGFTRFLGLAEIAGGLGVALGVLTQLAALGLILIMWGAIHRKIFVWKTGFWGKHGDGWSYDLLFVAMSLVIASTGGGRLKLANLLGTPLLAQAPTDSIAPDPAFTGHLLVNLGDVLSVGGMLEASRFGTNSFGAPPATITKPYLVARFGSYPGLIGATASGALIGLLALLLEGPTY